MAWVLIRLFKSQERVYSTRSAIDKAYQLLAHGRWFSPGTRASSNTKTGHHDIAEILLKVALSTQTINIFKKNHYIIQHYATNGASNACEHLCTTIAI